MRLQAEAFAARSLLSPATKPGEPRHFGMLDGHPSAILLTTHGLKGKLDYQF